MFKIIKTRINNSIQQKLVKNNHEIVHLNTIWTEYSFTFNKSYTNDPTKFNTTYSLKQGPNGP